MTKVSVTLGCGYSFVEPIQRMGSEWGILSRGSTYFWGAGVGSGEEPKKNAPYSDFERRKMTGLRKEDGVRGSERLRSVKGSPRAE